jgi:CelD/BcsL family acetyltransferase involved in cellulose biosynthesis
LSFTETQLVEFSSLSPAAWDAGQAKPHSLMQTHDWLQTAAEIYGYEGQNKTLIVGDSDAPTAMASFRNCGAMRGLRLAGAIDVGESVEALFADDAAFDDLLRGMVQLGVAVDLGHYPTRNDVSRRLRKAGTGRGLTIVRRLSQKAMPSLPLDENWKKPLQQCSRSRRQQYRRKWRKAEAIGPVSLEILSPNVAEVDPLFDRIMAVEARSWKGREGTALLQDDKQAAFFLSFGRKMAAKGLLRLCFLTVAGQDAAMSFATVWDNRFWAIKVGYDESFAPVSPGEALLVQLIRHSAEQDYTSFEFCGKDAPWTRAWAEHSLEIEAIRFYPFTVFGLGRLAIDICQMAKQRIAAKFATGRD